MKLLPVARLRVRLAPTGGGLATAAYALTLFGLELTGRGTRTDLLDLLAGLLLVFSTYVLFAHHRRDPLPWLSWLGRRARVVRRRVGRWRYDLGTDLRGTPVLPGRLPRPAWALAWLAVGLAGAAELLWQLFPGGWRQLGVRTLYTPYLVVILLVWAGLLGLVAAGLAAPLLVIDRRLRGRLRAADRRPAVTLGMLAYILAVVAVSWLVPTAAVLGLVLVVSAVGFAVAARVPAGRPGLLWRSGPGGELNSVPARRLVGFAAGLLGLFVFALLLAACGGRLTLPPPPSDPMPVTSQLGGLAAWLLPGLLAAAAAEYLSQRRHDPARRTPPTATVHPNGRPAADVDRAVAAVKRWGWGVAVAPAVQPGEVGVALVPAERSEATEFDPGWPLAVGVEDLDAGPVRERLARRDEVQLRREVFRGLAVLLKRASRGKAGGGVWFAPHWWLNGGLMRDRPGGKPGPPRRVGPPFAQVFGPRAVQHLHAVLRAVQIDLIFLEDGVSRKQFDRVLRAVFELYDVHAGQRPAEDRHFLGLPRVKVMVHDYAPGGDGGRVGQYRQPKFDDLTRARVLHVFRDDDGERADVEAPFDTSWEPSPALGIG